MPSTRARKGGVTSQEGGILDIFRQISEFQPETQTPSTPPIFEHLPLSQIFSNMIQEFNLELEILSFVLKICA